MTPRASSSSAGTAKPPSLAALRAALEGDGVSVRYQPVVRMESREPAVMEVLARLSLADGTWLEPAAFVPRLEAAGLAWRLTQAVMRRCFAEWRAHDLARLGMALAINVPLDAMLRRGAAAWIEREAQAAALPPSMLILELTETRPVTDAPALRAAMEQLRRPGWRLAIDDVGPAARALDHLLDMPFAALKLDKDLVAEAAADSAAARHAVQQTVAAARAAGMRVVAEGIEDRATWRRMAAMGIDAAQGFLIARPMEATALAAWRANWAQRP